MFGTLLTVTESHPVLIQGGMGIAVSNWTLAKTVSMEGQMGVISGVALDVVLSRRLEMGDLDGTSRRALEHFPIPGVAERILDLYYVEGGKDSDKRFTQRPMMSHRPSQAVNELIVAANFVEVWLAKEGHDGVVGVNFLEKVQAPNLASIYGVMLADVDYILMGAGIPSAIPGIMDHYALGEPANLRLDVKGATRDDNFVMTFDPANIWGDVEGAPLRTLPRPKFLAIISSEVLAKRLATKASGFVDGFIVEGPTAGGHNAPPRGKLQISEKGEPIYGDRDIPKLEKIAEIGRPFWMAGSYASAEGLAKAQSYGAVGIQVGTAFAYCEESGFAGDIKARILKMSAAGTAKIKTDARVSPTGFPFKLVQLDDTLSNPKLYLARERVCDLGYLRSAYKRDNGRIGWRCASEPIDDFLKKGGEIEDTVGRGCVCNALASAVDMPQIQVNGEVENVLVTSGDDVEVIARFVPEGKTSYSAVDVVRSIVGPRS